MKRKKGLFEYTYRESVAVGECEGFAFMKTPAVKVSMASTLNAVPEASECI